MHCSSAEIESRMDWFMAEVFDSFCSTSSSESDWLSFGSLLSRLADWAGANSALLLSVDNMRVSLLVLCPLQMEYAWILLRAVIVFPSPISSTRSHPQSLLSFMRWSHLSAWTCHAKRVGGFSMSGGVPGTTVAMRSNLSFWQAWWYEQGSALILLMALWSAHMACWAFWPSYAFWTPSTILSSFITMAIRQSGPHVSVLVQALMLVVVGTIGSSSVLGGQRTLTFCMSLVIVASW